MDSLSPDERSERMSRVRAKDTKPELIVRRLVYSLGYRYRLYSRKLPGHPDLVFKGRRKVIFVHGCFWHRHRKAA
jgi:DNA mismatch endonuclease, patch repair protein